MPEAAAPPPPPPAPAEDAPDAPSRAALVHYGKIALQVLIPLLVIWLVWREIDDINVHEVRRVLTYADARLLLAAVLCVLASLLTSGLYDVLCFPSIPGMGRLRRWGWGVLAFAWTNFITLGPFGGPALRLMLYRKAGMDMPSIASGIAQMYTGLTAGMLGFVIAAVLPLDTLTGLPRGTPLLLLRWCVAALVTLALCEKVRLLSRLVPALRSRAMGTRRGALVALIAVADWSFVTAAWVLAGRAVDVAADVGPLARAMLVGHSVGLVSMLPGGLGAADITWVKMLQSAGASPSAAAAHMFVFRVVYYLLPWFGSMVALYLVFAGRSSIALRWQRRILAVGIGVNGLILLLSSATPAVRERLAFLERVLPIDAIEASHGVAVAAAGIMLFLIRGILRGYRGAWTVAVTALAASIAAHVLKGADYEESCIAAFFLLLLTGARKAFTRRGRIPIGWELTLAAALGSVTFFLVVGLTAHHRLPLQTEGWHAFVRGSESNRFFRGALLLAGVGVVFLIRQAVKPVHQTVAPAAEDIDRAVAFIRANSPSASPLQVACGDKGIWWFTRAADPKKPARPGHRPEPDGLVVYQRRHDKMVVFSDPVCRRMRGAGAQGVEAEMLRALHAYADEEDVELVFYQLSPEWMEHLHDFGYTFFKLGEEAVVDLLPDGATPAEGGFTLEGSKSSGLRQTLRRTEDHDDGPRLRFEVLHPPHDPDVVEQCREVSDAWLANKEAGEMQFSVGYFSPAYLQRAPLAVARDPEGDIVAFVNILATAGAGPGGRSGCEVSFDFMRYKPGVTDSLMEYMIIKTIVWAQQNGCARLNLGMSPLYDVGRHRSSTPTEKLARALFEHGEKIYNYRGLHRFKDKFRPRWEPRYLAYQRPWDWASAVLTVTSLVKGTRQEDRHRIAEARLGL